MESRRINPLIHWTIDRIRKNKNAIVIFNGGTGCLTGDTLINVNRNCKGGKYSLKKMYYEYHNMRASGNNKGWDLKHPTYVRSYNGTSIQLHKINDVVYSGTKEVWSLKLDNGKEIKATKDHLIMTSKGWIELGNLTINNEIMCDTLKPQKGNQNSFKVNDIIIRATYHPYKDKHNSVQVHRLIYEANLNKLKFIDYLDILWNDKEQASRLKYIDPKIYNIHHKDENHYNNDINNLELMKGAEHKTQHAFIGEGFKHFNQGIPVFSKVLSVSKIGIEDTYDLVCDEPHHNFVANGIVVHNSGKTYAALDYAINIAKELGTSFTIQNNMSFKFEDLLKKMDLEENKKPGTVFLFEEVGAAGSGSSSREWQSQANKFFFSFAQTSRHKNQVFIMTCPMLTYLDAGTRQLIHMQMVMKGISHKKGISYAKPFVLQTNYSSGKVYKKYIRMKVGQSSLKVKQIVFNKPPSEIIDEYESLKTKFTTELYQTMFKPKEKPKKVEEKPNKECPYCLYKWKSKKEDVAKCPKCSKHLNYIPKLPRIRHFPIENEVRHDIKARI